MFVSCTLVVSTVIIDSIDSCRVAHGYGYIGGWLDRLITISARVASTAPPPPDSEDDEEDSFAEEIRKLRESRRVPTKAPEKDPLKEREQVGKLGDREKEEERDKTLEEEKTEGDAAIRIAANAELQSATRTIVSQLDLTLADMTERRKADLKAEEDAAAAMKEAEKKEKEAAEEKKKTEEKETKEREMEILRLIPMQGKLLTCSADIDSVLEQLEGAVISTQGGNESTANAEIRALRSQTQRKIQEIEARMLAAPSKKEEGGPNVGISWRNIDWAQDNIKTDLITSTGQDGDEEPEDAVIDVEPAEREAPFEEVLQRQVLEKLDLTMLKLRHVLSIGTKEAAEEMKTQQREQEEQERKHEQQQVEDERKQRELDDAETARRRVMGLTSIEDVEGQTLAQPSLNRLMASMEHRMGAEDSGNPYFNSVSQDQNEDQFDRLAKTGEPREDLFRTQNKSYGKRSGRRQMETKIVQEVNNPRWIEIASCSSDSEVEADSTYTSGDSEYGERLPSVLINRRQRSSRAEQHTSCSPPVSSPPRRWRGSFLNSHKSFQDGKSTYTRNERVLSKVKQNRRKRGASGSQQEVARTIQAL
ncbi:hypothetical protein GQ600_5215 [Phytophthora cactorum]|nr:hypothetical protein GQ600_5215 [Phytophthora cactorum]